MTFKAVGDPAEVAKAKIIASGLPAGPGAASGKIILNADRAAAAAAKGEKVLLVRTETSPEDLRGMIAAEGILTAKGGVSSHAALVARQMGKVCVVGCGGLTMAGTRRSRPLCDIVNLGEQRAGHLCGGIGSRHLLSLGD